MLHNKLLNSEFDLLKTVELSDVLIEKVKKSLRDMAFSCNSKHRPSSVLDKFSKEIYELVGKMVPFNEIAYQFELYGIYLTPDLIMSHCYQYHMQQITEFNHKLDSIQRMVWNESIERSGVIENYLKKALHTKQGLILHYQPQVNMATGQVIGAEALIRWEHEGRLIYPSEFIPVAEACGLILPIGEWVLREACKEAKRWQSLKLGGKQDIKINVNLSVKQLSTNLPNIVNNILCDTGLSSDLLGLEITESFLVEDNDSVEILNELKNNRLHLSMDDFGTGYACLAHLKNLPFGTVKIDRDFVSGIDDKSATMVESIIIMANKMGMKLIAEGIETEEQAVRLQNMGCSIGQGFLYSKAVSGDDFVAYVQKSLMD